MRGSADKAQSKLSKMPDWNLQAEARELEFSRGEGVSKGVRVRTRRVLAEARKRGLQTELERPSISAEEKSHMLSMIDELRSTMPTVTLAPGDQFHDAVGRFLDSVDAAGARGENTDDDQDFMD